MSKTFKWIICILILIFIIAISLLYAEQYSTECKNTVITHSFNFILYFIIQPFLTFVKDFNWAFLVLLLFLIPSCREVVYLIIERVGGHIVAYGNAVHSGLEVNVEKQTAQEQKEFKKVQQEEINKQEKDSSFKERMKKHKLLREFIKKTIEQRNINSYIEGSKLLITNDPILSSDILLFDYSYDYDGEKDSKCHVNTLVLHNSIIYRDTSKLYKYIRTIDDINKSKRSQRYSIEIIFLNTDIEKNRNSIFSIVSEKFKPAIDSGILILREYSLQNDIPVVINSVGWMPN